MSRTILEEFQWAQDPLQLCVGQPIIPQYNFPILADKLLEYNSVIMSKAQLVIYFTEQSLRFSACGANSSSKFGVLRRNPKTGWQWLVYYVSDKKDPQCGP